MPSLRTSEQPLGEPLRDHDRERHQLGGVVAGVAEHQALVARAPLVELVVGGAHPRLVAVVDAGRDVHALGADRDLDAARGAVEALVGGVVADVEDRRAHQLGDRRVGVGPDLAGHHDQTGREQRLDRRPQVRRVGVVLHQVVEDGVADPVSDLVRVTLGHRLRGEEASRHVQLTLWCRSLGVKHCPPYLADQHAGRRSQAAESAHDLVPDHVGQGRPSTPWGTSTVAPSAAEDHGLVVGAAEHRSPADVVDDQQVAPLAGQLGAGVVEHRAGVVAGLGGEPDDDRCRDGAGRGRSRRGCRGSASARSPARTRRPPS